MGAGNHDVRFFGGFCAAVHAVRAVPIRAEQPAQKRRMAQLCKGGARVSRTGAGAEISQRGRSDLPLGHPRPGGLSGAVDRYLYAARVLPAGQDPVQTRQRSTVGRSDAAVARDRYLFVRRLPVARNVGSAVARIVGLLAAVAYAGFRAGCGRIACRKFRRRKGRRRFPRRQAQRYTEPTARIERLFRLRRGAGLCPQSA